MVCLKNLEDEISAWPHVVEISASETRKWGTCTPARSLTYPFPAQSAMRCWTKLWQTSTIGFPIQVGSLSAFGTRFGTRMISSMPSGSCRA